MTRQLTPQQAFQTQCLSQMGVSSWLIAPQEAVGVVYYPQQPWPTTGELTTQSPILSEGFGSATSPVHQKLAPEEKEQTVASLREQLNTGPDIIVEDLQPIEELAVDIEPNAQDDVVEQRLATLDVCFYKMNNQLLVITDLPQAFSELEAVDKLAVKMAQALLKQPIEEWQSRTLNWPGKLTNPHFLYRQDWLLGAIESHVQGMLTHFGESKNIIIAGENIAQFLNLHSPAWLHSMKVAYVASLPELYRIPELRKDAWQHMQSAFA